MSRRPVRWIALVVGAAVVALSVLLAVQESGPAIERGRWAGKAVPAFDRPTLDGETVSSAQLLGKTYVVNFWNTWCIPCRQEHPELLEFYSRHRDDPDFAMIGIVRDDEESAVRQYVARERVTWTIALDPGAKASIDFGTTGQPETYVVAADGVVACEVRGPSTVESLEAMLRIARSGATCG